MPVLVDIALMKVPDFPRLEIIIAHDVPAALGKSPRMLQMAFDSCDADPTSHPRQPVFDGFDGVLD
jgi:hypothetical protein